MRHVLIGLGVCAVGLCAACGSRGAPSAHLVHLITETGCVTASGDTFVLTDLESASEPALQTRPTTEAYLLVGADAAMDATLASHEGERVTVSGSADPAEVTQIREMDPVVRTGSSRVTEGEQIRLEMAKLHVRSVDPTGERCEAAAPTS